MKLSKDQKTVLRHRITEAVEAVCAAHKDEGSCFFAAVHKAWTRKRNEYLIAQASRSPHLFLKLSADKGIELDYKTQNDTVKRFEAKHPEPVATVKPVAMVDVAFVTLDDQRYYNTFRLPASRAPAFRALADKLEALTLEGNGEDLTKALAAFEAAL